MPYSLLPVTPRTRAIPEGRAGRANFDMWFRARLPALGGAVFKVQEGGPGGIPPKPEVPMTDDVVLTNGVRFAAIFLSQTF